MTIEFTLNVPPDVLLGLLIQLKVHGRYFDSDGICYTRQVVLGLPFVVVTVMFGAYGHGSD